MIIVSGDRITTPIERGQVAERERDTLSDDGRA